MAEFFNRNGGFFSPPGYLKVETGGSHDENPNGGVQIGVDPQGIPNMLEEGEPVYNDYVYSDNIRADKKFLEQMHLPVKYADKLYSEIADALLAEAEERPLDAISNAGLEKMLGRLADAQDAQKQEQQEKELEQQLENMSPEELAQLDEMMSQQAAQEQMAQEQAMAQPMPQEQMVPEQAMPVEQQMPYAMGGCLLRKFKFGGDKDERAAEVIAEAARKRAAQQAAIDALNKAAMSESSRKAALRSAENKIKRLQGYVERDEKTARRMERDAVKVYPADMASYKQLLLKQYGLVDYNKKRLAEAQAAYDALTSDGTSPLLAIPGAVVEQNINFDDAPNPTPARNPAGGQITDDDIDWGFSRGGKMNLFGVGDQIVNGDPMTTLPSWVTKRNPSLGAFNYQLHNNKPIVFPQLEMDRSLFLDTNPPQDTDTASKANTTTASDGYATWPRFTGLAHNLFTAGVNAFQQPDHYNFPMLRARTPDVEVPNYIDPTYRGVDENRAVNDILATGAGTIRGALNSGVGPGVGTLLASIDNNTTRNIGSARETVASANNQARNTVNAQRNQNIAQRAGMMANLANARAQALAMTDRVNLQTIMRNQMMNNEAEQQWANAVSQPLDFFAKGMSDLGWENVNRNMANSMYDYWIDADGHVHYYRKQQTNG